MGTTQKLVVAGLVIAAFLAGHCNGSSIDADEVKDAALREKVLGDQVEALDNRIQEYKIVDALMRDSVERLKRKVVSHGDKEKKLAVDTEKLKNQVRLEISDSAFKVVEPLVQNYEDRLLMMAMQNKALQEILVVQTGQIQSRDSIIGSLRKLNGGLQTEIGRLNNSLQKAAHRSALERTVLTVGLIGVGAYVITH